MSRNVTSRPASGSTSGLSSRGSNAVTPSNTMSLTTNRTDSAPRGSAPRRSGGTHRSIRPRGLFGGGLGRAGVGAGAGANGGEGGQGEGGGRPPRARELGGGRAQRLGGAAVEGGAEPLEQAGHQRRSRRGGPLPVARHQRPAAG